MALVNCPECGRENVSDTADKCPTCGYAVAKYFSRIKSLEFEKEWRQKKIKEVPMPKKPSAKIDSGDLSLIIVGVGLCCFAFYALTKSGFVGLLFMIGGIWGIYTGYSQHQQEYSKKMKDYKMAVENFEAYQEMVVDRNEANMRRRAVIAATSPTCPICGSNNIKRIDAIDRSISIGLAGMASSKIGKQYECKKCKHKW